FFPATLVFGIGAGILIVPITIVMLQSLPTRYSGIAAGTNYAATRIGNMLAIAVYGTILLLLFQTRLSQRIAELPLDAATRTHLLSESRNLGATMPPPTLSPELIEIATMTIKLSFVDGFRGVMVVSMSMMLVSLAIALFFLD
ncbi:MAG: hypothetical protein AAF639_39265, partial [Chloroflexota bacterium]